MATELEPRVHKIAYETGADCNQPCGFCFATFRTPDDVRAQIAYGSPDVDTVSTLTTEEVKTRIIDPYAEMYGSRFHFTGADPFLRKDLPELVEQAKSRGLLVSVDTNGMIITQARNRRLFDRVLPQLYSAGIAFDARDRLSQIQLRGHGQAYRAPLRFLELSGEAKAALPSFPSIKINTILTSQNYEQVPGLIDLLEPYMRRRSGRVGSLVSRWSIDAFRPMERGAAHESEYAIERSLYHQVVAAVRGRLAERGLPNIVTGDQSKTNTTLLVSPQGVAYVPNGNKKCFVPRSVRDTPLRQIVDLSTLASRDEQYQATLGGTGLHADYRHPNWEARNLAIPSDL